jgi:DUF971 family protein
MIPTKIQLGTDSKLVVTWDDGHVSPFDLKYLRDVCPCASCRDEREKRSNLLPIFVEGKYAIKNIEQVGSYAVIIHWGDGHATGIYSWEYLREICPCELHQ